MRTLMISDVHLGQRGGGVSVLERPAPLATLLNALEDYDRLVLLGDTVELKEAEAAHALPVAELILRRIAQQLGPDKQLVLVPGNHDHELVREWAQAQGPGLARENLVPPDSSPLLAEVVSWLTATRVEVRYPGMWVADGVWAAHGHQLNHYMRPVSSWGLHTRRSERPETPAAFEYIPSRDEVEHMRDGLPPERAVDNLIPKRLAPLTAYALDRQMQRHAMPAFARAVLALGVRADWAIFGHVHRRGPRTGDDQARWSGPGGSPRLVNTGSWRHEPVVTHGIGPGGVYWPGGAVALGDDGVPRSLGLLDGLSEADLLAQ